MKVMVVGSGGREAGLIWAAKRSPQVREIIAAPGNDSLAGWARCVPVAAEDVTGLARLAGQERPDLVLIGPETPLTLGLADRLAELQISAFGPTAAAARLEGSKAFAKDFMQRHGIPSAGYRACTTVASAMAAVSDFGLPVVVKADGLAAGKGVTVAQTREEALTAVEACLLERVFGSAGDRVVIEEFLAGEEASVLAFCDGQRLASMVPAQDHKRVNDFDQGPNTGGMGAYAPAPAVTPACLQTIRQDILEPTLAGMAKDGHPYRGVLYAGLMLTNQGPKVIEYNCRFGDPETQVVLPLLETDLVETALACVQGRLQPESIRWRQGAAVCIVMASGGYPGKFTKGQVISGLEEAQVLPDVMVWHAGTARLGQRYVTSGGRVLNVIATAPDIRQAVEKAYAAAGKISFEGAHYRHDIAARALKAIRI